jgi:ankyrin repeat protein
LADENGVDRRLLPLFVVIGAAMLFWNWPGMNDTLAEASVKDRPLLRAAYQGEAEQVKQLLASKSDPNERDGQGWTALHHAASLEAKNHHPEGNHLGCVQALLKGGADPNAGDLGGERPLYRAVHDPDITEALLEAGADANQGANSRTPLISAAYHGGSLCTPATESIRLLLKKGADVNQAESGGFTALTAAAVYGCPGMVRTLLEAGARVDLKMQNGQTIVEWVRQSQTALQEASFGSSWRQVHQDNLKLLVEAPQSN